MQVVNVGRNVGMPNHRNPYRAFANQQVNMMRRVRRSGRRGQPLFAGLCGLGDDRYIPSPDQIVAYPTQGLWYRIKSGESFWGTSKKAYGQANVKKGLYAMNDATWNDHIRKASNGWEAYGIDGLQAQPKYSDTDPHAPFGSGNSYPVAWIPPLDTLSEPEPIYGLPDQPIIPGTGPAGPMGPAGPQGIPGTPGAEGPMGPMGPPGEATDEAIYAMLLKYLQENPDALPEGPQGAQGPAGDPGQPGIPGPIGPEGPMGPQGEPGAPGEATDEAIYAMLVKYLQDNPDALPQGPQGVPGPIGPEGSIGPMGPIGPRGEPGPAGQGGGKSNMWAMPMLFAVLTAIG